MQTFSVTLSSKGQLTLPAEVRQTLDIDRGARLRLVLRDDGTIELSRPRFGRVSDIAATAPTSPLPLAPKEMRQRAHEDRWLDKERRSQ